MEFLNWKSLFDVSYDRRVQAFFTPYHCRMRPELYDLVVGVQFPCCGRSIYMQFLRRLRKNCLFLKDVIKVLLHIMILFTLLLNTYIMMRKECKRSHWDITPHLFPWKQFQRVCGFCWFRCWIIIKLTKMQWDDYMKVKNNSDISVCIPLWISNVLFSEVIIYMNNFNMFTRNLKQ